MPIVQGFELGVPVAASDIPVIAEVADGAALLFDPLNQVDRNRHLERIWTDAETSSELRPRRDMSARAGSRGRTRRVDSVRSIVPPRRRSPLTTRRSYRGVPASSRLGQTAWIRACGTSNCRTIRRQAGSTLAAKAKYIVGRPAASPTARRSGEPIAGLASTDCPESPPAGRRSRPLRHRPTKRSPRRLTFHRDGRRRWPGSGRRLTTFPGRAVEATARGRA